MAKFGVCIQCGYSKLLNAKSICPDCVFMNNHDGKTKIEVYNAMKIRNSKNKSKKKRNIHQVCQRTKKKEERDIILQKDRETYLKVFENNPPFCEECGTKLPEEFETWEGRIIMVSQYSHILTKGAHKEFRHNPKNFNRLCQIHHDQWEFGDREKMKIYETNQKIIEELLKGKHE